MTEDGPARVRLRVVARGYDRDEVDARLIENDSWAEGVQARLLDIEAQLTEYDHRAKALEAKVAELEDRNAEGPPESVQWLHDMTDQILQVTSDDAHELMVKMENDALAEKLEAERAAAEMLAAAQARAAEICDAARFERDTVVKMRRESSQQVELFVEQSRASAEDRAKAISKESGVRLEEVTVEQDRIEQQRRAVLEGFDHVRGNVEELERYLGRLKLLDEASARPPTELSPDGRQAGAGA